MNVLLDTHVWLWTLVSPERLDPGATDLLSNADARLFLSAASSWEIAIKYRLGRLPLPEPPEQFIPIRLIRDGIAPLPVQHHHACRVAELPLHHKDPFDRLLVAQAQIENMTLATADRRLLDYDIEAVLTSG